MSNIDKAKLLTAYNELKTECRVEPEEEIGKKTIDSCISCTNCTNCISCHRCYNSYNCTDCYDCAYCTYCTYCILCVGLHDHNKGYFVLNKEVTKEVYEATLKALQGL